MIPLITAITPILGKIFGIVDKLVPDKDAAEKMKHEVEMEILSLQSKLQSGQIEINKIEAAHQSIFVAGWRPAIGWICAMALGWHFIGYDMCKWVLAISGSEMVPPVLVGTDVILELVLAMLGVAGFRTYEKLRGVAREK